MLYTYICICICACLCVCVCVCLCIIIYVCMYPFLYIVSATVSSDGIDLHLDLRPRLDAAYDEDPDAPPTTREGFVRIANRNRYDQLYYTAEARAATASLIAAGENFAPPVDVVQGAWLN